MEKNKYDYRDTLVSAHDITTESSSTCKLMIKSLYFSVKCRVIYILLLIYNIGLGAWCSAILIAKLKQNWYFYILEFIINFILICDVVIRFWIKGCYKYWHECSNVFEFFIVIFCVSSLVLNIIRKFCFYFSV